MRVALLVIVLAIGCDAGPVAHRGSPLVLRRLDTQPLEAEVPDDAGVSGVFSVGPDDGGFHGACVTLHAGSATAPWGCDGVGVIQDTTSGRRAEDAHVRVTSMAEDVAGLRHVTRTQQIADGWIIERMIGDEHFVDGALQIRPGTEQYMITVHRTIAGTPWTCERTARARAELAEVERLCLSIRAAP